MKTFISLIVPMLLVVTLSRDNQVNGECFELVQQYYECKNLVMVLDKNNQTYIPSTLVANNILDDAFYENLNLDGKTFDEAMDLFWQIYDETNSCNTEFCKCVSTGIIDKYIGGKKHKFSLYFRNATNYEQMKIILSDFLEKFKSTLKPYSDLEMFFKEKAHSNQVLPTLARFCIKYDYTDERFIYHNNSLDCFTDDVTVHDCKFDITVDKVNQEVITEFTNPMMEKLMTCNLANAQNCPVETQKFHLLTSWPQEYPTFAWHGDSLTNYYDKLITDSHNINPAMKFVKSYLITKNDTLFVTNLNLESSYKIKPTNQFVANLLISPNINIECTWVKKSLDDADNNYRMNFLNFSFRQENNYAFSKWNLSNLIDKRELNINSLNTNNLFQVNEPDNTPFTTFVTPGNQYNYYTDELVAFSSFDTYMHAFFNTTHFKIYLPDYQWAESSSVFVNGFDGFEPITTLKPTTQQSTQSTTESTEIPTTNRPTTANPFNSASRISSLSFNLIITFILLNLCKF